MRIRGAGTDHVGIGLCSSHGGSTAHGAKAAAREEALRLGQLLEIDPHDALLQSLWSACRWHAICRAELATIEPEQIYVEGRIHPWISLEHHARAESARIAKVCLDAGIEERQVRIAEQLVGDIAAVVDAALTGHGIVGAKRKPAVIRSALELLPGGIAA